MREMAAVDCALASRPMPASGSTACGDAGLIRRTEGKLFFAIVDGAGHGEDAARVARNCVAFIEENLGGDLVDVVKRMHEHLKGSVGAVAGLGALDEESGELEFVGIGNLTARRLGPHGRRLVPSPGIVGYSIRTPKKDRLRLLEGDVFLLCTDGVREHFGTEECPELLSECAEVAAAAVLDRFGREEDDAACIVLRYGR